jgi:hypothetical protein
MFKSARYNDPMNITASDSTARSLASDDDVVVTREAGPAAAYTVRQAGVVRRRTAARADAIQCARRLARRAAVNLWYRYDGGYRFLDAYRRQTS